MSGEQALVPIEQREIEFYEDEITAVLVEEEDGGQRVYVPIRPICDYMGVDWSAQRRRINRDVVLSSEMKGVAVTTTPSSGGRGGGPQEMLCLPLDLLNGFLFGINASRVKDEIRDRLIRYQRECYRVLADAFLGPRETAVTPATSGLTQVRDMALAIARLAEEQIEHERRLTTVEGRLSQAAVVGWSY